ncbi:MAG: hypothetical protein RLZZ542_790 [Pseudomonadota bacterium]|jgi:hypothetical protein
MISWGHENFQVPGLGHRVSGSGAQVRVLVPGLIPEPVPVPVPAAETWDPEMFLTFAQAVGRFALLHLGQHVVLSLPRYNYVVTRSRPYPRQSRSILSGFRSPFEFMARLDTESPPYPAPH